MNSRRLFIPTVAVTAAIAVAIGACGGNSSKSSNAPNPNAHEQSPPGDIPDNQAFVRVSPSGASFSVKIPEGWARSAAGEAVTFTDKLNSVSMQETSAPAALTVRDARQTEVPKLAKSVKGFQPGTVTSVARPAGRAIRITYLAEAPANAVTGKSGTNAVERYVFFHNGKKIVLTLSGPKGADNVDPWNIVTGSVRWSA